MQRISSRWGIDFSDHFADELNQLHDMEQDGLVKVTDNQVIVREPGRLLVRNICMIFDRYQRDGKSGGSFSRTV